MTVTSRLQAFTRGRLHEAEIATITGHSLKDVRSILDAHYFHRDTRLADSGIDKLELAIARSANPVNDNAGAAELPARKPKQFNGYTGAKLARLKRLRYGV